MTQDPSDGLPLQIFNAAKGVLAPVGGTLSDAWQAVIGDRVAAWRLKNVMATQVKLDEECRKRGLKLNPARVPERYAFTWFEEASKQDEPEIQQLFARLLAKAASGDDTALDRRLLEIVSRFVPIDATMFQFFYESTTKDGERPTDEIIRKIEVEEYKAFKQVSENYGENSWQSVEHLISLGLIERNNTVDSDSVYNALCNLQASKTGEIYPAWGITHVLEINTHLVSTVTGRALYNVLHSED